MRVHIAHDLERYSLSEGDPLEVVIRGQAYPLTANAALEIPCPQSPWPER